MCFKTACCDLFFIFFELLFLFTLIIISPLLLIIDKFERPFIYSKELLKSISIFSNDNCTNKTLTTSLFVSFVMGLNKIISWIAVF
jgi:hypothetical protein